MMSQSTREGPTTLARRRLRRRSSLHRAVLSLAAIAFATGTALAAPPDVSISNVPLTLVTPTHPQVLLVVGNSQSMDGDLSGAIMTGSGTATGVAPNSSSPLDYTIPSGFTPPCATATGSTAPYTVTVNGNLCDNSASRLNLAKAALLDVLARYSGNTDFGLMDFSTGSPSLYGTWVYYMSPTGGFTFTNSPTGTFGLNYVTNPCYGVSNSYCNAVSSHYAGLDVLAKQYVNIDQTSDDASINDVLYYGGSASVFVDYGGNSPTSPYPPTGYSTYSPSNYVCYNSVTASSVYCTGPTNAGYVPYSNEVLYARRGFGYYTSVQSNTGNLLVPVAPVICASTGTACGHPTQQDLDTYIAKFSPSLAPETNQTDSKEIKALAVQSPVAGVLKGALGYYTGDNAPQASTGCSAQRYVVLVTDGLPTEALDGDNAPPLGSVAATAYGYTATFNADGSLASTNDSAVRDAISEIAALKQAGIETYVIGLGAGVDPSRNPQAAATLKAMAVAGGTGDYFPATTPQAVATNLQTILGHIEAATLTTSAAAINSTGLRNGTTVYQAQFDSEDLYGDWTGNLWAYPVSSSGSVNTSSSAATWQAQSLLDVPAPSARVIATWNDASAQGVPFEWSDLSAAEQSALQPSDTLGPDRLAYLRGDTALEQRNGGTFRNRAHILGDIVDSNPIYVGAPSAFNPDPNYVTFQSTYQNRTPMVYVGSNDGMLHGFDANTGQEVFAFVPHGVFSHLIDLTNPDYNNQHEFFVDGSPNVEDVQFADGTWHTELAGGENDGGNSIFALDISDPSKLTTEAGVASHVLWEFSDADLGKTYSQPQFAEIATGTNTTEWVVVFGSGYNNADGNPYLYVVNAQTGALISRIDLCGQVPSACSATAPNGLSTPAVVSSVGSPIADTVYAGDLQGNLWRVDISSTNPNNWKATVLFHATDASGTDQPITTKPAVTLQPDYPRLKGVLVFFGTGQYLGVPDLTNTNTQSFYGVWDQEAGATVTRSQLIQQSLSAATANTFNGTNQVLVSTQNTVNWDQKGVLGWYTDMPIAGERVITDPRLDQGRVIFTAFVPSPTVQCTAGGDSYLFALNYATGGNFPAPEFDLNNDAMLNTSDQVSISGAMQNPVGMSLGQGYATAPTLLRTRQGSIGDIKLVTQAQGKITAFKERGTSAGEASWLQLQ